jgi:putative transposase
MRAMLGFVSSLLALVRAVGRGRGDLVAENLLLRQQLAVLTRPTRPQPRLRTRDRMFWVLVRWLWRDWRRHLVLVRPETVVGWHRQGWTLFWGGRSSRRPGRPRLDAETRALIARMARENPAWGSERIRGELLKLGIAVSKRSIQQYRQRGPARPPSQAWRTCLASHAGQLRAADASAVAEADVSAFLRAAVQRLPATCPRPPHGTANSTARHGRQRIAATPRGRLPLSPILARPTRALGTPW